jgi:hypothetical protein
MSDLEIIEVFRCSLLGTSQSSGLSFGCPEILAQQLAVSVCDTSYKSVINTNMSQIN